MSPVKSGMLAALALTLVASEAAAVDVYINNVLVTGVRDQSFDNVTVRLDAQGNVRIEAPNYRVERLDTTDAGPAGTKTRTTSGGSTAPSKAAPRSSAPADPPAGGGSGLSRRYWLVAQSSSPGRVQYRVEVHINGRLVRTFDDGDLPPPVEVTEYLRPGRNSVRIVARKLTEGGRRSESSRDWLRIVVADGHVEGTAVVIDHPGVIFTRNASQTDNTSRDFNLSAQ